MFNEGRCVWCKVNQVVPVKEFFLCVRCGCINVPGAEIVTSQRALSITQIEYSRDSEGLIHYTKEYAKDMWWREAKNAEVTVLRIPEFTEHYSNGMKLFRYSGIVKRKDVDLVDRYKEAAKQYELNRMVAHSITEFTEKAFYGNFFNSTKM